MALASPVLVRHARREDLDAVLALYVQLSEVNASTTRDAAAASMDAILAEPRLHLLLAEADGSVVGTVMLVVVPNLTHDARPGGQVANMVVDSSWRGTGAGRSLIEECLRLAQEAGCYKVQLQSGNQRRLPPNDAHGFYKHLGFANSSAGFRYYLT